MAVFGLFFFASKYCESFWEILRDSKFQNSKVILVRFRAFMTETFERHRSNQNRNTNWNEEKIWETFQEKRGLKVIKLYALSFKFALLYCLSIKNAKADTFWCCYRIFVCNSSLFGTIALYLLILCFFYDIIKIVIL